MFDITGKPVYLPFCRFRIYYDCFAVASLEGINWGQCKKQKVAKFDWIVKRWYFIFFWSDQSGVHHTEIRQNKITMLNSKYFETFNV